MPIQETPKPNFIIIGSAKCGTTTLAKILADHPECCFSRPKEVCFFCSDEIMGRGWEWYRKHFSHYTGEQVIGEATPAYTDATLHPNTAKRIFEFNPDVKLIYIVRNPYERFVSAWRMYYRAQKLNAREGIDAYFEESPRREADVKSCCYDFQINEYLKYFPEDQIHVLFLEDLAKDSLREMKDVCTFLGIDSNKINIQNKSGENKGDTYKTIGNHWIKLSQSRLGSVFNIFLPISTRRKLFKHLFTKEIPTPRQELSAQNKQAFWNAVGDDASRFLEKHGKHPGFWNLEMNERKLLTTKQL